MDMVSGPSPNKRHTLRSEKTQPMTSRFQEIYPNIASWVKDNGWIEIGQNDYSQSFVRALDIGGMIREGKRRYATLDDAFQALESGLAEWMQQKL